MVVQRLKGEWTRGQWDSSGGGGDHEEDSARLGGSSPVMLCCLGRDVKKGYC